MNRKNVNERNIKVSNLNTLIYYGSNFVLRKLCQTISNKRMHLLETRSPKFYFALYSRVSDVYIPIDVFRSRQQQ